MELSHTKQTDNIHLIISETKRKENEEGKKAEVEKETKVENDGKSILNTFKENSSQVNFL